VHADEAVPGADVALAGGLLGVVEDVARRVEKDHGLKTRQIRIIEGGGVLGRLDREIVEGAQDFDGGDPGGNRRMAKAGGAGRYQDAERGMRGG
jgi:hypothetical protein